MTSEAVTSVKSIRQRHSGETFRKPDGEPSWLSGIRVNAYEQFREAALPDRRMEAWKNINLDYLLDTPFFLGSVLTTPCEIKKAASDLETSLGEVYRLGLREGVFLDLLSPALALPAGVMLTDLMGALRSQPDRWKPYLEKSAKLMNGPFLDYNTASFAGGVLIYVPEGGQLSLPVHLLIARSSLSKAPALLFSRILVVLEKSAELTLVSTHENADLARGLLDLTADVFLGENSRLRWIDVQRETAPLYTILNLNAWLARSSKINMTSVSAGHVSGRSQAHIVFEGEAASLGLEGLAVLSGAFQRSDFITVLHQASHGLSRQLYKNILTDSAQAEYNSLVHVARGTKGSDADQLNRNLILSDDARAFSRPQLKIDADDVRASHGSATGQLQEEEIFYLRSRGLSIEEAEFALTYGFAQEILSKIELPGLRGYLDRWIRENLQMMAAHMERKGGKRG